MSVEIILSAGDLVRAGLCSGPCIVSVTSADECTCVCGSAFHSALTSATVGHATLSNVRAGASGTSSGMPTERLAEMRNSGMSLREIAAVAGIGHETVRRRIGEAGSAA